MIVIYVTIMQLKSLAAVMENYWFRVIGISMQSQKTKEEKKYFLITDLEFIFSEV